MLPTHSNFQTGKLEPIDFSTTNGMCGERYKTPRRECNKAPAAPCLADQEGAGPAYLQATCTRLSIKHHEKLQRAVKPPGGMPDGDLRSVSCSWGLACENEMIKLCSSWAKFTCASSKI